MSKATNRPQGKRNDKRNALSNQQAKYSLLARTGGSSRNRRNKNRQELITLGHEQLAAIKAARLAAKARRAEAKAKARAEGQARAEEQAALREKRKAEAKALRAERHAQREAIRQARREAKAVTLRKRSHAKAAVKAAAKAVRRLTAPAPEGAQAFLKRAKGVMVKLTAKEQRLMEASAKDVYGRAARYLSREIGRVVARQVSLQRLILNATQQLGWGC